MLSVVDGVSGDRRWSHRFALAHAALPQQIGEVAAQAARALLVEMHRTAAEVAARRPMSERSAGDLALQGWARLYDGMSPSNFEQAQQLFDQAVEKDPSHLRGLGGVNATNFCRAQLGWTSDRTLAHQRVLDTAARLEKLYPDETLTAFARGGAADIERRWDLRLSIYDRLCERDPANTSAHYARACGLLKLGRFDECVVEINEARRLSVDDFRAGWWCSFAACAELMAGRHEQAATEAQRAIAANACLPLPPLLLAAAFERDGNRERVARFSANIGYVNRYVTLLTSSCCWEPVAPHMSTAVRSSSRPSRQWALQAASHRKACRTCIAELAECPVSCLAVDRLDARSGSACARHLDR